MLFHWTSGPNRLGQAQQVEAVSKVDWGEYIEDGDLTELHLIASGLSNRDLETYIRAHPEELEKGNDLGHGPLWYASMFGELTDIRTLLKYGARLDENTFNFSGFFASFGSKAFDIMEEHLSSGALKSLVKKVCASDWFRFLNTSQLDDDEILAVDKLCLEYGFDVNYEFYQGQTLLMQMLQNSHPGLPLRVKQLLDHGADLELTDDHGKTALHHFIEANGHIDAKTFNVLVENGARLGYRTMDGTTLLHALILNVIQLEPIKITLQSDISGLLLDAKDSDGYSAFDLLILRARLLREEFGDCSVSLEAGHIIQYRMHCEAHHIVVILGKWIRRANEPDMERKLLAAFEALLHKVQEVQGIPSEEQYPSVESVLDQEDIDAEGSRLEGLPGSWPE